ncbi:MAG TPA: hypothetical protein PKD54_03100 [Pirellulaceae bacterium]|nr:hypothetical protein [Pirellulaceae bacterium]
MLPIRLAVAAAAAMLIAFCNLPNIGVAQDGQAVDAGAAQRLAPDRERVLAFRIALNQLAEKEEGRLLRPDRRKIRALRAAARDDGICEYLAWMHAGAFDAIAAQDDGTPDGPFLKWIKYIIENQEEIIKFILLLIDLFSWMNHTLDYVWHCGGWA